MCRTPYNFLDWDAQNVFCLFVLCRLSWQFAGWPLNSWSLMTTLRSLMFGPLASCSGRFAAMVSSLNSDYNNVMITMVKNVMMKMMMVMKIMMVIMMMMMMMMMMMSIIIIIIIMIMIMVTIMTTRTTELKVLYPCWPNRWDTISWYGIIWCQEACTGWTAVRNTTKHNWWYVSNFLQFVCLFLKTKEDMRIRSWTHGTIWNISLICLSSLQVEHHAEVLGNGGNKEAIILRTCTTDDVTLYTSCGSLPCFDLFNHLICSEKEQYN